MDITIFDVLRMAVIDNETFPLPDSREAVVMRQIFGTYRVGVGPAGSPFLDDSW
jgi:hypothetical protein